MEEFEYSLENEQQFWDGKCAGCPLTLNMTLIILTAYRTRRHCICEMPFLSIDR